MTVGYIDTSNDAISLFYFHFRQQLFSKNVVSPLWDDQTSVLLCTLWNRKPSHLGEHLWSAKASRRTHISLSSPLYWSTTGLCAQTPVLYGSDLLLTWLCFYGCTSYIQDESLSGNLLVSEKSLLLKEHHLKWTSDELAILANQTI